MASNNAPADGGTKEPLSADAPVPGARQALALLLAINLFNYLDRQVLAAVVPDIRAEFFGGGQAQHGFVQWLMDTLAPMMGGANPENAVLGLLAMVFIVSYMATAWLFALLPFKRWWIVAGGVALWSLASGATGMATTFGLLLLTRCFVGIGEAAYGPVAPTIISDLYPVKRRGSVLSWFYLAIPVGSALGFAVGGLVGACWGWRWAFYVVVPPGLLLAAWCLIMQEPRRGQADRLEASGQRKVTWKDVKALMRNPSYVLDTLGMSLMTFAIGGISFWMTSYITEFRKVSNPAQVNLMFGAILVATGLLATISGGWLADRLRKRWPGSYFLVSGISMILGMPFLLALPFVPFPYAWILIFMACFCVFFNTGPSNTILANVTHPSVRATAFAINILVIHALGDVISPMVLGGLTDVTGTMDTAIVVVGILIGLGGALWLWGARYLARDTERALKPLDS